MLDAYLESQLYSDPDYAIIAVSRPAGTRPAPAGVCET